MNGDGDTIGYVNNVDDVKEHETNLKEEITQRYTSNVYNDDDSAINPSHYRNSKGIESIDVIDGFTDGLNGVEAFDTGNIIKYACRWHKKNGIQDLKKVLWYTNHLIKYLEGKKEGIENE